VVQIAPLLRGAFLCIFFEKRVDNVIKIVYIISIRKRLNNLMRRNKMNNEKLQKILENHKLWLCGLAGGERANLNGADLGFADLFDADLRGADLRGADLCGAYLFDAHLPEGTY
jgi:hypothetical protein